MKIEYKLKEVFPRVFLVTIDDPYDLAMTFCRVQEFYESSFKEIRGKHFNMLEFQRMYSKKFGDGIFSYTYDWAGFNVPSYIIDKCYNYEKTFNDINQYDDIIQEIDHKITNSDIKAPKYYLIGSQPKCENTIEHEICHAFYYLHPYYKKTVNQITDKVSEKIQSKIKKWLLSIGYNDKVFKDELQAYLTADPSTLLNNINFNKSEEKTILKINKQLKQFNNEYKNKKV